MVYINADCTSNDGIYCDDAVTPIAIDPCPSGYNQTAYDTCCSTVDTSDCQDVAEIYAVSTTPVPTPNATSNLLSDPSFEEVCDGGKPWVKSGDTTVFSYDDSEFYSGSRCAKVSDRPQSYSGIRQSVTGFITPGEQYRISACTKLVSADDIRVIVKVSVRTTNKTDYYGFWSETSNSTHWKCHTATFTVDSEWPVIDANIYAETQGGSLDDFYIDDVSLMQL